MASTNPARGMRDFLPIDVRKRDYVIGIIKEVYESYGFEPLETPAVENIETLMGKYGDEGNQLIFKILKRGEKLDEELESYGVAELQSSENPQSAIRNPQSLSDLALRYDLTVPLARVVANNKNKLPKFFKRYQIQPVWRADRPARGRFREFYQCDVDCIGSESMVVEAEIISAASAILSRLGFGDFVVKINHRRLLTGLLTKAGVAPNEQSEVLSTIDKLDKIGPEGVLIELADRGLSSTVIGTVVGLFGPLENKKNQTKLSELLKFFEDNDDGRSGVRALTVLLNLLPAAPIKIDPSLARGLSYYTGTIMEINVPDLAGSLGGGGRYDNLIGDMGVVRLSVDKKSILEISDPVPACGFSLGLERILVVMDERGMFPPEIAASNAADVMVTIWNEETIGESLKLAAELRAQNLRVTVYPEADKLGKQFKYASQINVPWVCVLGETELAENKVMLKNMESGAQETVERNDVAKTIKARI